MNCWSISSLEAPEFPFAWLRSSELGIAIKGADELKLRDVSAYLSMLGSHVFSTAVVAGKRADGVREIREISTSPSDEGYFSRVAWKLTFHSANSEKLLFRPAELDEKFFSDAKFLSDSQWRTDLLNCETAPIPFCQCVCGESYVITTRVCPVCNGENPLGWALDIHADTLIPGLAGHFKAALEKTGSQFPDLTGILHDLSHFIEVASSEPEFAGDDGNEKERAKVLLSYYARLFEIPDITKESIEGLRLIRERKFMAIAVLGAQQSLKMRRSWGPQSMSAWAPNESFQQTIIQELSVCWKQPMIDLKEAVLKMIRAAALYRPIEKPLREVADRDGWGDFWHNFAKPTLTVISAVKTFGISLALKAGMSYMKAKKDQERFEAFAAGVSETIVTAEIAIESSGAAIDFEQGLHSRIAEGFQVQMANILFADYAGTPTHQQENFIVGLLNGLGLDASGIKSLRPRGLKPPPLPTFETPQNRVESGARDHSNVPLLIVVLSAAAILVFLLLVLLFFVLL